MAGTIIQQLADAIGTALAAAGGFPGLEQEQCWDVEPEQLATSGALILGVIQDQPREGQPKDDPTDEREVVLGIAIWARTRAAADALLAALVVKVCQPIDSASPFFQHAYRIRQGLTRREVKPSGNSLILLNLIADTKNRATDPTRWN